MKEITDTKPPLFSVAPSTGRVSSGPAALSGASFDLVLEQIDAPPAAKRLASGLDVGVPRPAMSMLKDNSVVEPRQDEENSPDMEMDVSVKSMAEVEDLATAEVKPSDDASFIAAGAETAVDGRAETLVQIHSTRRSAIIDDAPKNSEDSFDQELPSQNPKIEDLEPVDVGTNHLVKTEPTTVEHVAPVDGKGTQTPEAVQVYEHGFPSSPSVSIAPDKLADVLVPIGAKPVDTLTDQKFIVAMTPTPSGTVADVSDEFDGANKSKHTDTSAATTLHDIKDMARVAKSVPDVSLSRTLSADSISIEPMHIEDDLVPVMSHNQDPKIDSNSGAAAALPAKLTSEPAIRASAPSLAANFQEIASISDANTLKENAKSSEIVSEDKASILQPSAQSTDIKAPPSFGMPLKGIWTGDTAGAEENDAISISADVDLMQNLGRDISRAGAPNLTTHTAPTSPPSAPQQVAYEISRLVQSGSQNEIEIRLDPEELGSVRLVLATRDTGMIVTIYADRPDTLDLLRRNSEQLAEQLTDIGYSDTNFEFSDQSDNEQEPRRNTSVGEFDALGVMQDSSVVNSPLVVTQGMDLRL